MHQPPEFFSSPHRRRLIAGVVAILLTAATGVAAAVTSTPLVGLLVSRHSDHSQSARLAHSSLTDTVYVFVGNTSAAQIQSVSYYLDDALAQGTPTVATTAPFDFGASGLDLSGITPGTHTLLAVLRTQAGSEHDLFARFAVGDTGGAAPATSNSLVCTAKGATATTAFDVVGATADDATDDFAAIQAAIDKASAAGGGVIHLSDGVFITDGHIQMKDNVKLVGAGPTTVIKAGPNFLSKTALAGGWPVITTAGAKHTTIASLTADQSGDTLDGNGNARLAGYLIDIRNSDDAVVDGVSTRNPFTYSIAVVGTTNFCVTNSDTRVATVGRYDQLDGIHILDSNNGEVINNDVDQRVGNDGDDGLVAHTMGAPVHDVLYANNKVRGGAHGDGMQLADGNFPIYNLTIRDNEFYGSPFGIRTGYYDAKTGDVHDINISDNFIHDLKPGVAFPDGGNAIEIGGFGGLGAVTNITITNNRACNAGEIKVVPGNGNVVTGSSATC